MKSRNHETHETDESGEEAREPKREAKREASRIDMINRISKMKAFSGGANSIRGCVKKFLACVRSYPSITKALGESRRKLPVVAFWEGTLKALDICGQKC